MSSIRCTIVDDEEMSRKALEHLCSKVEDLEIVDICENGIEALKSLENTPTDILFLDVEMPDLTGLELLDNLIEPPLVVLTTSKENYAVKAFEYNVDDYLVKPISYARLIQSVNKLREKIELSARFSSFIFFWL